MAAISGSDLRQNQSRVQIIVPAISLDYPIAMGAAWGVASFAAYSLVEYLIFAVWPLFTTGGAVLTAGNWRLTALLLNSYWVLGALAGGLFGALSARLPGSTRHASKLRPRLAATFSLYLAVVLNILTGPSMQYGARTVLALSTGLLCATAWALFHPESKIASWVAFPPILAALLIQVPVWIGCEFLDLPVGARRIAVLCIALSLLAAGRLAARLQDRSPSRHLAASLILFFLLVSASAGLSGRNRAIPSSPATLPPDPGTVPVVLISLDTTRADHLSVYGYGRRTTPNLEEFARHATLYTDLVAASDWTLPSHASIFTGMYPSWHGAHLQSLHPFVLQRLDRSVPTLAGILRDRGIFTVGVAANKAYLSPIWGLARGFQSFNMKTPVEVLSPRSTYYLRYGIRKLLACCANTDEFDAQCRTAAEINSDAIAAAEDRAVRDRSFFLFVNYMDAHTPYVAGAPETTDLPSGSGAPDYARQIQMQQEVVEGRTTYPEAIRARIIERYDAGIAAEDAAVGDLVGWLKRRGLYDRSLIVITADHGEAFGEHKLAGHGIGTYQDQTHVPLLVKFPGQSAAQVVATPVSHVDILPTVLQTLSIPVPSAVQGRVLPRRQENGVARPVFSESYPNTPFGIAIPRFDRTEVAVRSGPYKLIVSDKGKHELYDLSTDPGELHNLTARGLPEAATLETAVREWTRQAPARRPVPATEAAQEMRALKGLGYVR